MRCVRLLLIVALPLALVGCGSKSDHAARQNETAPLDAEAEARYDEAIRLHHNALKNAQATAEQRAGQTPAG